MRPASPLVLRLLAAVAAALALLLGPGVTAAWAHDGLVASVPAADATVPMPPAEVRLEFGSAPQPLGTQVLVRGAYGVPVSQGDAQRNGSTVTRALAEGLPAGSYTVEWRVTSADGHPVAGTFGFTVADDAPADPMGAASTAAAVSAASADAGDTSFPFVWVAIGAIVAVAAVLVVRQLRRPA
jgi:methionine-rich copper-binding protein CopC